MSIIELSTSMNFLIKFDGKFEKGSKIGACPIEKIRKRNCFHALLALVGLVYRAVSSKKITLEKEIQIQIGKI